MSDEKLVGRSDPLWCQISGLADWIECEFPDKGLNECLGPGDVGALREAARCLKNGERTECEKCGSTEINTRYCDGEWIGGERKVGGVNPCERTHSEPEELHRVCRNCQFRWDDPVLSPATPD